MSDPLLEHYSVVVVDQVHQRTVATDVLQGLLKDIALQRPELRVVLLSSAEPSPKQLTHFTGSAPPLIHLESPGAGEVVHSSTGEGYFCSALRLALEIHHSEEEGDVVVFLVTAQVQSGTTQQLLEITVCEYAAVSLPFSSSSPLSLSPSGDRSGP